MKYFDQGYQKFYSKSLKNKISEINTLLINTLGIDSQDVFPSKLIQNALLKMFEDKDLYLGFLKAFANSPLVQSIAYEKSIMNFAKKAGIGIPTLVTNPILHVVAKNLIINERKVFTPPHQDVISTKGSIDQIVFWVPLHEIEDSNYGIEAYPNTHKLGILPFDENEFGHTVKPELLIGQESQYLKLKVGEAVAFSQYLIHKTHKNGNFRMALSFRFNNIDNKIWQSRKFFVPFDRISNLSTYSDSRHEPEKYTETYFDMKSKNDKM
jgi:hypothetical protein